MISRNRMCINRKTVPGLSLPEFLRLVNELGIHYVELRNDLGVKQSNTNILDGMDVAEVNKLLTKYQIKVTDINSLGNSDLLSNKQNNLSDLKEMIAVAKEINTNQILFCPTMSKNDLRSDNQKFKEGVECLNAYSSCLNDNDMSGLFETLGFPESSIRTPFRAIKLFKSANISNFKVVADIFHWYMGGVTKEELNEKLDVSYVGLIHMSTIVDNKPKEKMTDQDRVLLEDINKDVINSYDTIKWFDQHGYTGLYSFEGFSDVLKEWNFDTAKNNLEKSINLLEKI